MILKIRVPRLLSLPHRLVQPPVHLVEYQSHHHPLPGLLHTKIALVWAPTGYAMLARVAAHRLVKALQAQRQLLSTRTLPNLCTEMH